mmetsp:Transcript_15742/g.46965  ORF Transcript_15742/g.46965 Transcript_15742/m.46965 type:complete len:143 (-) Transcript_15742:168-596(-)
MPPKVNLICGGQKIEDPRPEHHKKRQKQTGFEPHNLNAAQRAHIEAVIKDPMNAPVSHAFNWHALTTDQQHYMKPTREQMRNANPWKHYFIDVFKDFERDTPWLNDPTKWKGFVPPPIMKARDARPHPNPPTFPMDEYIEGL